MSKLIPYLFVFAGIVIGILATPSILETLTIAHDVDQFREVEALVRSQQEQSHGKGPKTVEVKFEFVTEDGVVVRGDNRHTELSDDLETVDRLVRREGGKDRVTVWYDPADPQRHVISRDVPVLRPIVIVVFVLIAVFGGTHAIIIDRRRRRLQARADADRAAKEAARAAKKAQKET